MDKALVYGTRDSGFDPQRSRCVIFFLFHSHSSLTTEANSQLCCYYKHYEHQNVLHFCYYLPAYTFQFTSMINQSKIPPGHFHQEQNDKTDAQHELE